MVREDYISLEVAKLIDAKGFGWFCPKRYWVDDGDGGIIAYHKPTTQLFQKWLREVKEIHIMIDVSASGYFPILFKTNGTFVKTLINQGPNDGSLWDTYEEALDAGFMEALKFI